MGSDEISGPPSLSRDSADRIRAAIQARQRTFRRDMERRVSDLLGLIEFVLLDGEIKPWSQ